MVVGGAVVLHGAGQKVAVGGRGIGDGIGTRPDGGADGILRGAAGGDDGQVRIEAPDVGHHIRRGGGGRWRSGY